MKNFYEATVIKPELTVDLEIHLKAVGSLPCEIQLNNQVLFSDIISGTMVFKRKLPLMSDILIEISVDRVHPEAVIVENINVDNYNIIPAYQHVCSFDTNYIDFNNETWRLNISGGFYPWYHSVSGQGFVA